MITADQTRAARAFLNWRREDLAERSGVSVAQISNFETGKVDSPRLGTIEALEAAFRVGGVGFKEGGIVPVMDCTTRFEGKDFYLQLLDDVYRTLMDVKNPEAIVLYGAENLSPPEVIARWKKIRNLGTKVRRIVREGDTHLMGPLNEYRYLPSEYFAMNVAVIYANKVAVCAAQNTMALVIDDAQLAETFKRTTDFHFSILPQPEYSDAPERL